MNPLKIFEYEPLDRSKLSWPAKVFVFFLEWIARILAAFYVSISLIIVSIIPFPGASKTFFRVIGTMADMYCMRWMKEEEMEDKSKDATDRSKDLAKGNDNQVSKVANRQ